MAVNKVIFDGNALIDLTSDTVTSETLQLGKTAHAADGTIITGTLFLEDTVIVPDPLLDDGDDPILDSSGNVIEGRFIFVRL